jgi:hypothetical protein
MWLLQALQELGLELQPSAAVSLMSSDQLEKHIRAWHTQLRLISLLLLRCGSEGPAGSMQGPWACLHQQRMQEQCGLCVARQTILNPQYLLIKLLPHS